MTPRARLRLLFLVVVPVVVFTILRIYFPDGVFGAFLVTLDSPDATVYSRDYRAIGFWRIKPGMSQERVKQLLGEPIEEEWIYRDNGKGGGERVVLHSGRVQEVTDLEDPLPSKARIGMTAADLTRIAGAPMKARLFYTVGHGKSSYRQRSVVLEHGIVSSKAADVYLD